MRAWVEDTWSMSHKSGECCCLVWCYVQYVCLCVCAAIAFIKARVMKFPHRNKTSSNACRTRPWKEFSNLVAFNFHFSTRRCFCVENEPAIYSWWMTMMMIFGCGGTCLIAHVKPVENIQSKLWWNACAQTKRLQRASEQRVARSTPKYQVTNRFFGW